VSSNSKRRRRGICAGSILPLPWRLAAQRDDEKGPHQVDEVAAAGQSAAYHVDERRRLTAIGHGLEDRVGCPMRISLPSAGLLGLARKALKRHDQSLAEHQRIDPVPLPPERSAELAEPMRGAVKAHDRQ
jgi:hypothetical protein